VEGCGGLKCCNIKKYCGMWKDVLERNAAEGYGGMKCCRRVWWNVCCTRMWWNEMPRKDVVDSNAVEGCGGMICCGRMDVVE
jgi:hypothetical protein